MIKYQILFRHLFFCKHVELQLCRVWLQMQTTKELEIRAAMGHSYSLRQRMIHFVQNLLYYVSVEVLEQHWHELDKKIRTVKTIDEVMEHHNNFLDTCLKECLLTNPVLRCVEDVASWINRGVTFDGFQHVDGQIFEFVRYDVYILSKRSHGIEVVVIRLYFQIGYLAGG